MFNGFLDHIHSWANALTNASYVLKDLNHFLYSSLFRITKDALKVNESFMKDQLDLWNGDRTGFYSAAPRTLGLASASDLLSKEVITNLVDGAKRDIDRYATEFANGNSQLQQGIRAQHQIALDFYESDHQLPVEFNIGTSFIYIPRICSNLCPHRARVFWANPFGCSQRK